MLFEDDYMDIASDLLSEMRLVVEGAVTLFEDKLPVCMRWARDNNEHEALSALNDVGSALYLMRRHIKRLQAEHHKATTSNGESGQPSKETRRAANRSPPHSRRIALTIINLLDNSPQISNETINILAAEAQVQDESQRAAKIVRMLKVGVGSCVHHEQFGKPGLCHSGFFAGLGKALGKVIAQGTFALVLHGSSSLLFLVPEHKTSVLEKGGVHHEAHIM